MADDSLPKGFFLYDKRVTVWNGSARKHYQYHYWALMEYQPATQEKEFHRYCGRVDKVSRGQAVDEAMAYLDGVRRIWMT